MSRLGGLRVLVTRPDPEGSSLATAIRAAGGQAVCFPAMAIRALAPDATLDRLANGFPQRPLSVFVSRNAVRYGVAWLRERSLWPAALAGDLATVGAGSAAELASLGAVNIIAPHGATGAEALLGCPELADLRARDAILFQGVGGSDDLADALVARGARVFRAAVYRRTRPSGALPAALLRRVDLVTATSTEVLRNLHALAGPAAAELLKALPLLVTSDGAAREALARGHRISPIITPVVGNEQIVDELAKWLTNRS